MIVWATPGDVTAADIGGVTSALSAEQVSYWLERARRAILAAVPEVEARVASGRVPKDAPGDVQVDLVLSKVGNPAGIRTIQETNGPSSGSVTYGGDNPGAMVLTADQVKALGGVAPSRRVAGTVNTW